MASLLAASGIKGHNTAVRVRCGETTELCRLLLPFEQECARRLQLIYDLCTCDDTVEARFVQIQNLMEVWEWEDLHWLLDQKRFDSAQPPCREACCWQEHQLATALVVMMPCCHCH